MFLLGFVCGFVVASLFGIAVTLWLGRDRHTVSVRGMKVALSAFDRPSGFGLD